MEFLLIQFIQCGSVKFVEKAPMYEHKIVLCSLQDQVLETFDPPKKEKQKKLVPELLTKQKQCDNVENEREEVSKFSWHFWLHL